MVCYWRIFSLLESIFSLDFDKFSTAHVFLYCVCNCALECVDFSCLERKWTYRCQDLGFLSFSTHFYGLFRKEMDVLMSIFGSFWFLLFLRCHHCTYVIDLLFSLSWRWCDVHDFSFIVGEGTYSTSFCSQILLSSDYSPSRFIYIL